MRSLVKKYIKETVQRQAKIGYDRSVKQWYGVLDHAVGLICSQRKTRAAVSKELAQILEEFIVLDLRQKHRNETKAAKVQRAYSQA